MMTEESKRKRYTSVSIPVRLAKIIEEVIESGVYGYTSVGEFVRDAVRRRLEELGFGV